MQLPDDILSGLDLTLSRHKNPASLDWHQVNGKWIATEGDRLYQVVNYLGGYVIAETKSLDWGMRIE